MVSTLDPKTVAPRTGSIYPPHYAQALDGREKRALGDVFGLTQFGVNLTVLPPGCWSSQRHWHDNEDEFVYVVEGEVILVDEAGEHNLKQGMCAGFKAGHPNAHHLVNRSDASAVILEVGTRASDERAHYAEADMAVQKVAGGKWTVTRKDGTAF